MALELLACLICGIIRGRDFEKGGSTLSEVVLTVALSHRINYPNYVPD